MLAVLKIRELYRPGAKDVLVSPHPACVRVHYVGEMIFIPMSSKFSEVVVI